MRANLFSVCLLGLLGSLGCQRGGSTTAPAEAGTHTYNQVGPLGLSVESVRLGRVHMRDVMGREGESKEDVFIVKTRFKLFDTSTPVKQPALQREGGLISIGESGLKLVDEHNIRFKALVGGLDGVRGRRGDAVVLTAEHGEATDLLTFESVATASGDLTLEIPANYQLMQPNSNFLQPKDPGTFKLRIPKALWSAPPPTTDVGPGNWATVGPVSVCLEAVRFGKVKIHSFGFGGGGSDSKEDALSIAVRVKLADPAAHVKKPPYVPGGAVAAFAGSTVSLRAATGGEPFKVMTSFGLNQIAGRQEADVELSAARPELTDLLTFDASAAQVNELVLTIWPKWQEKKPDGTWGDPTADGEFRFRIPKSAWAK